MGGVRVQLFEGPVGEVFQGCVQGGLVLGFCVAERVGGVFGFGLGLLAAYCLSVGLLTHAEDLVPFVLVLEGLGLL